MSNKKMITKERFNKVKKALEKKINAMPHGDLIHIERVYSGGYDIRVYPAYGFYCGFVPGDKLQMVTDFAKTLGKACTLCRNWRYNGYFIKDEFTQFNEED